ncbi:membrane bound O-acyl transferase, MBOAT [Shewanella denitrificans OS217]|jgi:alginate O-acetyltransferase complex protein AlgI|uniref:Probable alginate O-acetylase n=1 Tax=Shewanella denitrificans (strain OS217 / ATCC BAA-1090 / DSM 15013) TaxID=318161 RepID=Q12RQ6_SHEDO|nr:MBOAT family O-acyltransferase [Shewanella denitrificans]ABE53870.1 membrane bound O-acyl transferase, MBOAT [Shewanella denitrificans OS217]
MIFNTPIFFWFFCIFILFYGFVFLKQTPRVYLILVGSLVFYGAWNYSFIPLLVGSGIADYFIAQAIANSQQQRIKQYWLGLSIALNIGILAVFKYADFALNSVASLLDVLGYQPSLGTLAWVLPVGISFYTFQSMSYTIDVYRGEIKPRKGLVEFVAALSFFPQLVAGPILRAKHILPQMHAIALPKWDAVKHGFLLISVGLLKKTGADLLAIPANKAFEAEEALSTLEMWTGVLAFTGQIYGDFSGYTDMAIGIALLLGFSIPLNFRVPYFALSPVDFWRRWHISLSSWLKDYLYISLGGNRNNHRARNIFITMLLGGLWHGAAWTFVAWGAFHGAIITATHYLGSLKMFNGFSQSNALTTKFVKWAITFYLVMMGWVLFRAVDMSSALLIFTSLHDVGSNVVMGKHAMTIFTMTAIWVLLVHVMDFYVINAADKLENQPWLFWSLIILIQTLCLLIGEPSNEFIYFQF